MEAETVLQPTEEAPSYDQLISFIKESRGRLHDQQLRHELSRRLSQVQPVQSKPEEQLVYNLLQIPASQRSADVVARIDEWLHELSYFRRIIDMHGEKSKHKLVAAMSCSYYRQGKQIIRVGEESDRFYVILRGEAVVLYVRDNKDVERENAMIDREALRGMSKLQRIRLRSPLYFRGIPAELIENFDQYFNSLGVALYDAENILLQGQSFGELGIIFRQKRLAHILCRTECLIATVPAEQYMQLLAEKQESSIHQTMHFLEKYFFSGLEKLQLKEAQRYLYLFTVLDKKMHSEICSIRQPIQGFYIVLEGSVALKKEACVAKARPRSAGPLDFFRDQHKRKLQEYKMLLIGESFGLEELVLNQSPKLPCFQYSACATSNSRLLFCPALKLLKLMKNDKQLSDELLQRVHHRLLIRSKLKFSEIRFSESVNSENCAREHLTSQPFPPKYQISRKNPNRETIRSSERILSSPARKIKNRTPSLQISLFDSVFSSKKCNTHSSSLCLTSQSKPAIENSRLLAESLLRKFQAKENVHETPTVSSVSSKRIKRTCRTAHPKFRK